MRLAVQKTANFIHAAWLLQARPGISHTTSGWSRLEHTRANAFNVTPAWPADLSTWLHCRLERALTELGSYRRAEGRSTTPDFEEEDRLRADLNTSEAQKRQLGQDSRQLAGLVLRLAAKQGSATASGTPAVQQAGC